MYPLVLEPVPLPEKRKETVVAVSGGKVSPAAVLVIQDGVTKMVSVKDNDNISKLLDMIPDFVNKFMKQVKAKKDPEGTAMEEEAREAGLQKEMKDMLHIEPEEVGPRKKVDE